MCPLLNVRRSNLAPSHPNRFATLVPYHHHCPLGCAHPTTFHCRLPPLLIVAPALLPPSLLLSLPSFPSSLSSLLLSPFPSPFLLPLPSLILVDCCLSPRQCSSHWCLHLHRIGAGWQHGSGGGRCRGHAHRRHAARRPFHRRASHCGAAAHDAAPSPSFQAGHHLHAAAATDAAALSP